MDARSVASMGARSGASMSPSASDSDSDSASVAASGAASDAEEASKACRLRERWLTSNAIRISAPPQMMIHRPIERPSDCGDGPR